MMAKAALVTGASSGISRMVAQELKNAGFQVYAAARRVDRMADLEKDGITPVALDLTRTNPSWNVSTRFFPKKRVLMCW